MAATPNTGKTSARYLRLLTGGYNLSGDMRAVSRFGTSFEPVDATAWADDVMQYLSGFGNITLEGFQSLFSNAPVGNGLDAGSHTVLADAGSQYTSLFIGIRSAPAVGNPAFSAAFEQGGYMLSPGTNDALMCDANFYTSAVLPRSTSVWGVALATGATWNATTNGASVDNGASSPGGYIAFLHVTQTAGDIGDNDWAFKIEHSSNDSTFTTLATFDADGSEITAERVSGSSTVNRYVRLVGTRTAGTARVWASFIRL